LNLTSQIFLLINTSFYAQLSAFPEINNRHATCDGNPVTSSQNKCSLSGQTRSRSFNLRYSFCARSA